MVTLVDGLFVLIILAGVALAVLGLVVYRRWDQLGVPALAAFAVILGLGSALSGAVGLFVGPGTDDLAMPEWGQLAIFAWAISSVPWLIFSLQYTGRYTRITWRTVGMLYAPLLGFFLGIFHAAADVGSAGVVNALSSVIFIYCFALVFLAAFLLIQATRSYLHLSLWQGIGLATTPIIVVIAANSIGALQDAPTLLIVGQYTAALIFGVAAFGIVILNESLLEWTPAVETIGERAITRESDDLILLVDEDETIVKCNETAAKTLSSTPVSGKSAQAVLGHESTELDALETISVETITGKRRYDPQVSPVTDGGESRLGAVLSLRDVTDRELREQRLAVLNRVLRHNLRNKVDVVKSHAEVLDDERGDEHAMTITETADEITELGYRARRIDQIVSESGEPQQVDLVETIETVWTDFEAADSGNISVTLELPERATVKTNPEALEGAIQSALDNAVNYANSAVELSLDSRGDGYEITISDDGSGIPARELESLDAGTETPLQHGTGLGLWQLKWAVTTIGGELSFDTSDGTTVRFTVPDQRKE